MAFNTICQAKSGILHIWEEYTGPSTELAKQLGMKRKQLARQIREARRIATSSDAVDPAFQALQIQPVADEMPGGSKIELSWGSDKVIRFPSIDTLVDFLKRAS